MVVSKKCMGQWDTYENKSNPDHKAVCTPWWGLDDDTRYPQSSERYTECRLMDTQGRQRRALLKAEAPESICLDSRAAPVFHLLLWNCRQVTYKLSESQGPPL